MPADIGSVHGKLYLQISEEIIHIADVEIPIQADEIDESGNLRVRAGMDRARDVIRRALDSNR